MATVHVIRVTQGWPVELEGMPEICTVDVTIDVTKYVRMGYLTSELTSSTDTHDKLVADASILLDPNKQADSDFPFPIGGTDRPDLVPEDFDI